MSIVVVQLANSSEFYVKQYKQIHDKSVQSAKWIFIPIHIYKHYETISMVFFVINFVYEGKYAYSHHKTQLKEFFFEFLAYKTQFIRII